LDGTPERRFTHFSAGFAVAARRECGFTIRGLAPSTCGLLVS